MTITSVLIIKVDSGHVNSAHAISVSFGLHTVHCYSCLNWLGSTQARDDWSIWSKRWRRLFSFKLVFREPPNSIILEPAENRSLHLQATLVVNGVPKI